MKFTTLTARFPGKCKRCQQPINVGDRIRYGGKGLTYHLADECPASATLRQDTAAVDGVRDPRNYDGRTAYQPVMTAELAKDIRQTFTDLLARPANLPDMADDRSSQAEPEPQPEPTKQITMQYNGPAPWHVTGTKMPAATPATTRPTIDADLF